MFHAISWGHGPLEEHLTCIITLKTYQYEDFVFYIELKKNKYDIWEGKKLCFPNITIFYLTKLNF